MVGAGQLGSRYLQGLSIFECPLRIFILDINPHSLELSKDRVLNFDRALKHHEISYHLSITECPNYFDLVIDASTSHTRPIVIKGIFAHAKVRFWILEKILAHNISSLNEIEDCLIKNSVAWVNTPRRIIDWHKQLKKVFNKKLPLDLSLT